MPEQKKEETMEYLRDGSGNEGEGGTVAVREGRSTRKEVARQHWLSALRVIQRQRKFDFEGRVKL